MDIEGRLHSAHRRSQITMMKSCQTAKLADAFPCAPFVHPKPPARLPRAVLIHRLQILICIAAFSVLCTFSPTPYAQSVTQTGPQQLSFAGLRAVSNQGQINAVKIGAQNALYLLIDQKDGVCVLKTDPSATTVLAQAQIGAKGDIGLAMALDPTGNVYITGTTTSGALKQPLARPSPRPPARPPIPS